MNILLIIGLVVFVCAFIWLYMLFLSNISSDNNKKSDTETCVSEQDVIERCNQLFEKGMHAELQRYAQRELAKNYSNVDLRRILASSLMITGAEQMAIAHYEAILSIEPYDIRTQELLAEYYRENGPKLKAIELYEQILIYDHGNINAIETLAQLYEETGNFQGAIDMNLEMLNAEIDEEKLSELRYKLANLYLKVNDIEQAFDAYKKIHDADCDNLEILMLLADLAYKNKFYVDCLKYYEKVISIVGDDFEILEKIAQLNVILENWDRAIEIYKKIVATEDTTGANYLYHQNELCNAMLKNGQYREAAVILKDLLSKNPKETSFAFTLAQAYTLLGEYQIGINLYNKLLDDLPKEQSGIILRYISNLICTWAQDLFKKSEYNQAFDKFFEALKYDEENDEVYYQLGRCNYIIKSYQDAIAHFKRAIAIKPQESMYYFGLGCAYDETGMIKNAKVAFYDAININPMNTKARIAYAISLTKELEYAQSIEQFREVLKYVPDNADTIYNLALAYELVGDVERAIIYYRKTLDVDKNHKEARHNLELILGEPYNPKESDEYVQESVNETSFEQQPLENTQTPPIEIQAENIQDGETENLNEQN